MVDVQVGEIVQLGQGIVEGEVGVELQVQGSVGFNYGWFFWYFGGCV